MGAFSYSRALRTTSSQLHFDDFLFRIYGLKTALQPCIIFFISFMQHFRVFRGVRRIKSYFYARNAVQLPISFEALIILYNLPQLILNA